MCSFNPAFATQHNAGRFSVSESAMPKNKEMLTALLKASGETQRAEQAKEWKEMY